MRTLVLAVLSFLLIGCTSLQLIDLSSAQVRDHIRAGQIVQLGDRISVTTEDGKTQEFKVAAVTDSTVQGGDVKVLIDSIVSVRTKQRNRLRTALATTGIVAGVLFLAAAKGIKPRSTQ